MNVRKLAVVGGVVLVGLLCWMAAIGATPLVGILVTAIVLVGLIAGGNALNPRPVRPGASPPAHLPHGGDESPPAAAHPGTDPPTAAAHPGTDPPAGGQEEQRR